MNYFFKRLKTGAIPLVIMGFSAACGGGGGGGGGPTQGVSTPVSKESTPPLEKKVFQYKSQGRVHRASEVVVEVGPGYAKSMSFFNGIFTGNQMYHYQSLDGQLHLQSQATDRIKSTWLSPGRRVHWADEELPARQSLSTVQQDLASFQTSSLGSWEEDITLAGPKQSFHFQGAEYQLQHLRREVAVRAAGQSASAQSTVLSLEHPELGVVREEVLDGDSKGEVIELVSLSKGEQQGFQDNGSQLQKAQQNLVLDYSDLSPKPHMAYLSEIYELALSLEEWPREKALPAVTAQGLYLFHQIYLYPQSLPSVLSKAEALDLYVSDLRFSDPYTYHFKPEQNERVSRSFQGQNSQIGLYLEWRGEQDSQSGVQLVVREIVPLSRAYYDGFQVGDVLTHIGAQGLSSDPQQDISALLPKAEGEKVVIGILRQGRGMEIETASEGHMAWMLDADTLYVNVRQFTLQTGSEVMGDVEVLLQTASPKRLILDLRGNSGGSASGAKELLDYLADHDSPKNTNVMYSTRPDNRDYHFGSYVSKNLGIQGKGRVVVLIDERSASASEVLSGVLQAYGDATVMGVKSYGKGVGQSIFKLIDGSGLWITSSELMLLGHQSYHLQGIEPDHVVVGTPKAKGDDVVLEAAQRFLAQPESFKASLGSQQHLSKPKAGLKDPLEGWLEQLRSAR